MPQGANRLGRRDKQILALQILRLLFAQTIGIQDMQRVGTKNVILSQEVVASNENRCQKTEISYGLWAS